MRSLAPLVMTLALVTGFAAGAAASPAGYVVDWASVRAKPPAPREEPEGLYTCSVQRDAPDSASRILAIAECTYPRGDLLAALASQKGYEFGSDTVGVPVWWSKGKNERRVPYAATRAALEHYLKLTQKYRDREYREPGMQPIFTSALTYQASAALEEDVTVGDSTYRDVWVAHIHLSWTYDDGTFLPFVSSHRTVVLSRKGEVLAVDGDGQAVENVEMSNNRAVGRERRLMR